ncbi:MAG: DUF167 domain-containing protein [Nanoarchaeota archaeon]|nr:DUF167 domain-containing protein [Nanoarchaeota archaeon]
MNIENITLIKKYLQNNRLTIHVKPNSSSNEIISYDENKKALKVNIAAAPDKDKANKEVIKFFSKILKKKVRIAAGLRSREKIIELF